MVALIRIVLLSALVAAARGQDSPSSSSSASSSGSPSASGSFSDTTSSSVSVSSSASISASLTPSSSVSASAIPSPSADLTLLTPTATGTASASASFTSSASASASNGTLLPPQPPSAAAADGLSPGFKVGIALGVSVVGFFAMIGIAVIVKFYCCGFVGARVVKAGGFSATVPASAFALPGRNGNGTAAASWFTPAFIPSSSTTVVRMNPFEIAAHVAKANKGALAVVVGVAAEPAFGAALVTSEGQGRDPVRDSDSPPLPSTLLKPSFASNNDNANANANANEGSLPGGVYVGDTALQRLPPKTRLGTVETVAEW